MSSCKNTENEIIPDETVIGTKGEILGVSYYTDENESVTHTILFEIPTKKSESTEYINQINSVNTTAENKTVPSENISSSASEEKIQHNNQKDYSDKNINTAEKTKKESGTVQKNSSTTKAKHVPVSHVKRTKAHTESKKTTAIVTTKPQTEKQSQIASDETVPEEAQGINVVFISDTVLKGDDASIMIQGNPGKKYSMKFYTGTSDTDFTQLEEQTADADGFVSWTFRIQTNCQPGNRKIFIKEIDSSDYIQTSIKVK